MPVYAHIARKRMVEAERELATDRPQKGDIKPHKRPAELEAAT